jgi:glycosyltransferase involved in cell wall biosynthesis
VIGARIGGIPEVVPESCEELLFTPGDADDLARALKSFCVDPERYAVAPGSGTGGWDGHVAGVERAYRDAVNLAEAASSTSEAVAGSKP